jgi:hypothetical protein
VLLGPGPALLLAALLAFGWAALRVLPPGPARQAASWARETAILLVLFAAWQEALGVVTAHHLAGALEHGMSVWRLEHRLHLPAERSFQHAVLHWPDGMRALNYYYAGVHVQDVVVGLVWVMWRHPDRYPTARNLLAWVTAATVVVQAIPVAPPRLLPATGVVDAGRLLGYAIYPLNGLRDSSQLTAMPSVHVAWALWVAVVVIRSSSSRWRWLVVLHPLITVASVVATGYHFWLDAVAAAALVVVVVCVQSVIADAVDRGRRAPRSRSPEELPTPARA